MKLAIVGFDRDGRSAYKYYKDKADITVCDINEEIELPENVASKLGDGYLDNLDGFDLIIRTSGINPEKIIDKNPGIENKITSQLNEFIKLVDTTKIIGVTGTKGKGTTTTLIHNMLIKCGLKSVLAGNIGIPFFEILDKVTDESHIVLELSSFQLEDFKGPSPHICVCLIITEDHLNWHGSMDNYLQSKSRLFCNQSEKDIAIYFSKNNLSKSIAYMSPAKTKLPYFDNPGALVKGDHIEIDNQEIIKLVDVKLLGKHNLENICAAVTAVWQVSQNVDGIRQAIADFEGLEHRLELVREVGRVKYYNDSFASNPAAAVAAFEAIEGMKVVIVGGFERNLDLEDFAEIIKEKSSSIRKVVIIGESGKRLNTVLNKLGFNNTLLADDLKSMADIVSRASTEAKPGDSVVLSPGFASFDMFKNFEDRGNQFKQAVNSL